MLTQLDLGSRPERKNIDLETTFAAPLTASFATPQLINGCAQGVNINERIGRRIVMKSVQFRAILSGQATASQHRIVVVYDKQANGAAPIATDVFSVNTFYSPLSLGRSDRFVVVLDEITDSIQSQTLNISAKRYVKCNLETIFSGTTSGIASITSGSLYMFVANNADPTIGVTSTAYMFIRVRYTDV